MNSHNASKPVDDRRFLAFPYIKHTSELVASIINRGNFIVRYRCLNKLNKFVKVHKDSII